MLLCLQLHVFDIYTQLLTDYKCHGRISTVPGTIVYWAGTPALEGFEGQ